MVIYRLCAFWISIVFPFEPSRSQSTASAESLSNSPITLQRHCLNDAIEIKLSVLFVTLAELKWKISAGQASDLWCSAGSQKSGCKANDSGLAPVTHPPTPTPQHIYSMLHKQTWCSLQVSRWKVCGCHLSRSFCVICFHFVPEIKTHFGPQALGEYIHVKEAAPISQSESLAALQPLITRMITDVNSSCWVSQLYTSSSSAAIIRCIQMMTTNIPPLIWAMNTFSVWFKYSQSFLSSKLLNFAYFLFKYSVVAIDTSRFCSVCLGLSLTKNK